MARYKEMSNLPAAYIPQRKATLKSRGGSHPRSLTNNTQIIQLNNKIAGNAKPERGRTVTDNPFEIAVDQKAISFEQVNVKNFASAQK